MINERFTLALLALLVAIALGLRRDSKRSAPTSTVAARVQLSMREAERSLTDPPRRLSTPTGCNRLTAPR